MYSKGSAQENRGVYVSSIDPEEPKETTLLVEANSNAAFASGHLLFVREGTLMAQPFDDHHLRVTGDAHLVADGVAYNTTRGQAAFSVSNNGVLAYRAAAQAPLRQLAWFDRESKQRTLLGPAGDYREPSLSPDEKRVALLRWNSQLAPADIWLVDLTRGVASRFTSDAASELDPIWSPDGRRILFTSNRGGPFDLYWKASNGAGGEHVLLKSSTSKFPTDWSRDGRFIVYEADSPKGLGARDLWVLPLDGDQKPVPFLATEFNEVQGRLSPDGRWMAYVSNESGTLEVYVQRFPTPGDKLRISTNGGLMGESSSILPSTGNSCPSP